MFENSVLGLLLPVQTLLFCTFFPISYVPFSAFALDNKGRESKYFSSGGNCMRKVQGWVSSQSGSLQELTGILSPANSYFFCKACRSFAFS